MFALGSCLMMEHDASGQPSGVPKMGSERMSIQRSSPLMIEVRANEIMPRTNTANIPYSAAEIIEDAIACAEAGAAIYHWHAPDPISGKPLDDAEAFIAVAEGIRAHSDIVLKPTTGFNRDSADARMAHIKRMVEASPSYVDIVPIDNFSANSDRWDAEARQFATGDSLYSNTRGHIIETIRFAQRIGVPVSLPCPDIGAIRTGICYREMGLLPGSIHWELVFSGDSLPLAAAPSLLALQAMVAALPAGDGWSVFCTSGDILPLVGTIILMGGHVAIGLGDHAHTRFGPLSNAELVQKVRQVSEIAGRPLATTLQAREMLGLRSRTGSTDKLRLDPAH